MLASEELILLIKSKYPVIFVESVDEQYVINHLRQIAGQLGLSFFQWSVTTGLQTGSQEGGVYQTGEPEKMLRTVLSLIKDRSEPGLFALKDFDKHLENVVILRLFKDVINLFRILEQNQSSKPLAVLKSEEIQFLRDWAKERTIPA
jgi:hypothetical protein